METWIQDLLLEEGRLKPMPQASAVENTLVDTLLQQLNTGDLRTQVILTPIFYLKNVFEKDLLITVISFQVVKWQNACLNMHLAVKEIVLARKENQLDKDTYTKMLQTACSKLCALPICIMTWFLSYKSSSLVLDGYVKVSRNISHRRR